MSENGLRLSQLLMAFGPGAMVDLPEHSVVISGLQEWRFEWSELRMISEQRLTDMLEPALREKGLLEEDQPLQLRYPPKKDDTNEHSRDDVPAFVFPQWFVCSKGPDDKAGDPRRLVQWRQLAVDGRGKRTFQNDDGKKLDVTPIRFVGGCPNGHLQDIDWRRLVHQGTPCREPMWLKEGGTSGSPTDVEISCDCGRKISLEDIFAPGRLGGCDGYKPWLATPDNPYPREACQQNLRFLTRAATNTYFPQVASVISLPVSEDRLEAVLSDSEIAEQLRDVSTVEELTMAKRFNNRIREALRDFTDEDILQALQRPRTAAGTPTGFKEAEFDTLASGRRTIGAPGSDSRLYAETLPCERWRLAGAMPCIDLIESVVAVHRLREVTCLYGFTRFEPPPAPIDDGVEEVRLSVEGAPLADKCEWLPAIEQLGEGIFLKIDAGRVANWLASGTVRSRETQFAGGFDAWKRSHPGYKADFPGIAYVALHSLSHALMTEIALECGYPASSLKERIYALRNPADPTTFNRLGLLIYTATAGAQGTLGGLVGAAERIAKIFANAQDRLRVCSNDPICADHEPGELNDEHRLLGAACHACLLVAETSCEHRNQFLDRTTLVDTLADASTGICRTKITTSPIPTN